jgi:hypothetical protein
VVRGAGQAATALVVLHSSALLFTFAPLGDSNGARGDGCPLMGSKPVTPTPYFFEHSVKNRATFQRPAAYARNIVYAYD